MECDRRFKPLRRDHYAKHVARHAFEECSSYVTVTFIFGGDCARLFLPPSNYAPGSSIKIIVYHFYSPYFTKFGYRF